MTRNIVNARVTFRDSPIHVLERFTFRDIDSAYSEFKEHSGLEECVIVQTCNRVELFGTGKYYTAEKIKKTWASLAGLEENAFKENLELSENEEAFHHLLKLTSGLDSMVIGEEQILGQIKDSITAARERKPQASISTPCLTKRYMLVLGLETLQESVKGEFLLVLWQ